MAKNIRSIGMALGFLGLGSLLAAIILGKSMPWFAIAGLILGPIITFASFVSKETWFELGDILTDVARRATRKVGTGLVVAANRGANAFAEKPVFWLAVISAVVALYVMLAGSLGWMKISKAIHIGFFSALISIALFITNYDKWKKVGEFSSTHWRGVSFTFSLTVLLLFGVHNIGGWWGAAAIIATVTTFILLIGKGKEALDFLVHILFKTKYAPAVWIFVIAVCTFLYFAPQVYNNRLGAGGEVAAILFAFAIFMLVGTIVSIFMKNVKK